MTKTLRDDPQWQKHISSYKPGISIQITFMDMRNHLHFLNPVIPSDVLNYDSSIRTKHTSSSSGSNPGISIQITLMDMRYYLHSLNPVIPRDLEK